MTRTLQSLRFDACAEPATLLQPVHDDAYAGLVSELGEAWADIARRLPGRAEGSIKNRFNRLTGRRKKSFHPTALDLKAAVTAIGRQDIQLAVPPRGAPSVLWTVHGSDRKRREERGGGGLASSSESHSAKSNLHIPNAAIQKDESSEDRAVAAAVLAHMGTTSMSAPTHNTAALPSHAAPGIQVAGVKRRRADDGAQRVHDRPFAAPASEPLYSSPLPFPPHHMYPGYPTGQWVYAAPPTHPMPYHPHDIHMHMPSPAFPSQWSTYSEWCDPTGTGTQHTLDMRQAVTQRLPSPMMCRSTSTSRSIEPCPASMYGGTDASALPFHLSPPIAMSVPMPMSMCPPPAAHIRGPYGHTQAYESLVYARHVEGYA